MSTQFDNDPYHLHDNDSLQYHLPQYYRATLKRFRRISQSFILFHFSFITAILAELSAILFFFSFLSKSAILAFALGTLFLTSFSYFLLLFYFQTKKPEQMEHLLHEFLNSCRKLLPAPLVTPQHHLSLADALLKLSHYLQDFESNFYRAPAFLQPLISRFSSSCYRGDVSNFKKLLLEASIQEHLKQIRSTPTDLEVHASLASTYVTFANYYRGLALEEKAQTYSKLAIEEFKILSHYAPNDPWVHEQLSTGYRDLALPEEEIKEVELLLKLRPQDKEMLFRLGALYFRQGMNAKGLQIYEELKQANFKQAEDLVSSYGIES